MRTFFTEYYYLVVIVYLLNAPLVTTDPWWKLAHLIFIAGAVVSVFCMFSTLKQRKARLEASAQPTPPAKPYTRLF